MFVRMKSTMAMLPLIDSLVTNCFVDAVAVTLLADINIHLEPTG